MHFDVYLTVCVKSFNFRTVSYTVINNSTNSALKGGLFESYNTDRDIFTLLDDKYQVLSKPNFVIKVKVHSCKACEQSARCRMSVNYSEILLKWTLPRLSKLSALCECSHYKYNSDKSNFEIE